MTATIYSRAEDLERRRQMDALAATHRHGEAEERVYAAQVERATADERCETMVRRSTMMRTSACE